MPKDVNKYDAILRNSVRVEKEEPQGKSRTFRK